MNLALKELQDFEEASKKFADDIGYSKIDVYRAYRSEKGNLILERDKYRNFRFSGVTLGTLSLAFGYNAARTAVTSCSEKDFSRLRDENFQIDTTFAAMGALFLAYLYIRTDRLMKNVRKQVDGMLRQKTASAQSSPSP